MHKKNFWIIPFPFNIIVSKFPSNNHHPTTNQKYKTSEKYKKTPTTLGVLI